jgi:hypothetical protein
VTAATQHISDAANTPGTIGFYLLTPLADTTPAFSGTFNGNFRTRLSIDVVNIDCATWAVGTTVKSLTSVLVYPTDQLYKVNTNVTTLGLVTGNCYRVIPKLDGAKLGFRDAQVTTGTPATGVKRWTPGSNLTFSFRLEGNLDADGDGVLNHVDNCPTTANQNQQDSNSNGVGDACEVADADGDGIADSSDNCAGTYNPGQQNSDGDAAGDACDGCSTDASKIAPGVCGCGFSDADSDGDGYADGPGGSDATAACGDVCTTDNTKHAASDVTGAGHCGCNIADTDSDGDGYADCNDGCVNNQYKTAAGTCGCSSFDNDADGDGDVDNCPPVLTCPI